MSPTANETQNETMRGHGMTRQAMWMAAAVGAGSLVSLAFFRRRPSKWEMTKRGVSGAMETAREEYKPWMGYTAGAIAGGMTLLSLVRRDRETAWERRGRWASEVAHRTGKSMKPWAGVAASTAIGLASAYGRRGKPTSEDKRIRKEADQIAEAGSRLMERVRHISAETRSLYPKVKQLVS
jgi:hypothetical protein